MRSSFAQRLCLALMMAGAVFAAGRLMGHPGWLVPLTLSVSAVWLGVLGWRDGMLRARPTAAPTALDGTVTALLAGAGGALCALAAQTTVALLWISSQSAHPLVEGTSWGVVGATLLCVSSVAMTLKVRQEAAG